MDARESERRETEWVCQAHEGEEEDFAVKQAFQDDVVPEEVVLAAVEVGALAMTVSMECTLGQDMGTTNRASDDTMRQS